MLDLTYTAPAPKVIAGAKHDWELVIGMENILSAFGRLCLDSYRLE